MRISTRGRYAMRLMLDLAINNSGEPVRLKDAARRQNISEKYLEQIISILNKAGYVRSIRGPQGGYVLAYRPSEYTAGMILRLTEGSLTPVEYAQDGSDGEADSATSILWDRLNDAICQVVDHITLEDLLQWQMAKANSYVI
ncbi:MAG: Rrf2 family transcriptional regulator [Lachnospiraceae bacterium]|nr:Rrf2 family transcriptional regulator [Lachnospiraceae bacterium]